LGKWFQASSLADFWRQTWRHTRFFIQTWTFQFAKCNFHFELKRSFELFYSPITSMMWTSNEGSFTEVGQVVIVGVNFVSFFKLDTRRRKTIQDLALGYSSIDLSMEWLESKNLISFIHSITCQTLANEPSNDLSPALSSF